MTEADEPVNPTIWDDRHTPQFVRDNDGLTKREYFTGQAIIGILANSNTQVCDKTTVNDGWLHPGTIAMLAVQIADATIIELNQKL